MKHYTWIAPAALAFVLGGCETWNSMWDRDSRHTDSQRSRDMRQNQAPGTGASLGVTYPMSRVDEGYDDTADGRYGYDQRANTATDSSTAYRSTDGRSSPGSSTSGATVAHTSNDGRILSYLHTKNQEEIEAGRLAQTRGSSAAVREYGRMLAEHHESNDRKVMSTASTLGVQLSNTTTASGTGTNPSPNSGTNPGMSSSTNQGTLSGGTDALSDLRNASGADFDRLFAEKMVQGHRDAIRELENARPNIQNGNVRSLVEQTLPALREHEQKAQALK